MSEIFRYNQELQASVPKIIDPREHPDLERRYVIGMPDYVKEALRGLSKEGVGEDDQDKCREQVAAFERLVACQIFTVTIHPEMTRNGPRTIIDIQLPSYDEHRFLASHMRKMWEEHKNISDPVFQRNILAAQALEETLHKRNEPIREAHVLPHVRIALGTMYMFEEADGLKVAVRINNDYDNNKYAGWGNPMSGLLKAYRHGAKLEAARNISTDEIIPAIQDERGRFRPMRDEEYFKRGGAREFADHAALVEGTKVKGEKKVVKQIVQPYDTNFRVDRYDTGIDLRIQFNEYDGDKRWFKISNVNPVLTPQGSLEVQTLIELGQAPQYLFDKLWGSDIVIVRAEDLADWGYKRLTKQPTLLKVDRVLDGSTGLPYTDPAKAQHYRDNFNASPPLWAIVRRLIEVNENPDRYTATS